MACTASVFTSRSRLTSARGHKERKLHKLRWNGTKKEREETSSKIWNTHRFEVKEKGNVNSPEIDWLIKSSSSCRTLKRCRTRLEKTQITGGGRGYGRRYLMKGTVGQSSSSENEATRSRTFLCAGMSALVAVLTNSDTLRKHEASCEGVCSRSTHIERKNTDASLSEAGRELGQLSN